MTTLPLPVQVTSRMPHYLARVRYKVDDVHELLKGWPLYAATGEAPHKEFSEGGAIDRTSTPTEAGFAKGAQDYADLIAAVVSLPYLEASCVIWYWKYQLNQAGVREKVHRRNEMVGMAITYGTLWATCRLTGLPEDALRKAVDDWIEDRRNGI